MKFGKEFRIHLEETLPQWRDKFLCYKPLKKLLKNISPADAHIHPFASDLNGFETSQPWISLEEWFIRILNEELEKFNDFYIDKEEEFVIRFQVLKERIERARDRSGNGGIFTSESEFSEEMLDIRKDYVTIHGEMVLLKNYSSLNFTGLDKILKKYDKRTGGLLRLPFTQRALHQPFFTTEPLTRLVHECEANLELLFPSQAEVIESDSQNNNSTHDDSSAAESSVIKEDTVDIYRSTLAAIRALQGLRTRASSTCSPLSLASFFQNQGEDVTGAITDENSVSSSSAILQNDEADQDDVDSNK